MRSFATFAEFERWLNCEGTSYNLRICRKYMACKSAQKKKQNERLHVNVASCASGHVCRKHGQHSSRFAIGNEIATKRFNNHATCVYRRPRL